MGEQAPALLDEVEPAPAHAAAARILLGLAWIEVLLPGALLVYMLPIAFLFILFGGIIVVAPPIAFAIVGFRLGKSLRRGYRARACLVFALVQGVALLALSLHSTTWDVHTTSASWLYWTTTFVTFLGGSASVGAALLIASGGAGAASPPENGLELRPRLWPWLFAALCVLLLVVLFGWAQGASG